jgi:hypothetical protein
MRKVSVDLGDCVATPLQNTLEGCRICAAQAFYARALQDHHLARKLLADSVRDFAGSIGRIVVRNEDYERRERFRASERRGFQVLSLVMCGHKFLNSVQCGLS